MKTKTFAIAALILAAAFTRLIPHPYNFAPITAMALFAGAHISNRFLSFFVPLVSLFISDLVIGFYSHMWVIYVSFALIVCLGRWKLLSRESSTVSILGTTLAGSVLFFMMTNLVGICGDLYPVSIQGMFASYTAAIPFFRNALLGDVFYTAVLFGSFELAKRQFILLHEPSRA